jgi:myosin heavy subunit
MSTPQAICNENCIQSPSDADLDLGHADDRLLQEMRRLAAINQELLGKTRSNPKKPADSPVEPDELARLRAENAELRALVAEWEKAGAGPEGEAHPVNGDAQRSENWPERQKEYEALLDEKSEVIRSLHLKIQELQNAGAVTDLTESQLLKKDMEDQRRQLEEDEESLMQQMRQMEMAMSKDRAELARQRNEIQRLHSELNHEIEVASRDPGLRERLIALQRLQGEITGRKSTASQPPAPAKKPAAPATAATATVTTPAPPPSTQKTSGLFRRIFGK